MQETPQEIRARSALGDIQPEGAEAARKQSEREELEASTGMLRGSWRTKGVSAGSGL